LDDAHMAALKAQGISGVVSLCLEHTDDAVLAAKYGIPALNVKILDNSAPTFEQMMEFIDFARGHAPTYVHCEAGQGRTGTAVACYRIAVDGWTADRAIAEAGTYGLSLINQIAFIRSFAERLQGKAPA
jgi:atypical dual specificity phosphatase